MKLVVVAKILQMEFWLHPLALSPDEYQTIKF